MPVSRNDNLDVAYGAIVSAVGQGIMAAAEDEKGAIEEGFANGHDALGRDWEPLSPITIEQTGPQILFDEGDLSESVFASRRGPVSAVVGVSDWKVGIHEYGTETIPRRPIIEPARIDLRENRLQSNVANRIRQALQTIRIATLF